MAINFPDSPTNGQVALVGGKNYTYNSTKNTWTPTQVTEADLSTVGSTTVVATHDLLPSSPSAGDMALVSSVNKMYVYFLSGWWLMSSLQNASPSGITGNGAIYDLAADGTPTTVTLSSSDPEGFPIVWTHSVISGSLGGTTVTNVNNVFTITPSTDAADAGTFTLRFAASDGQGGESGSQSQFTLDFVFTITNSKYTTLLATADGTSDNNNITDASTNNHTITVNGDAHAGTFSPYRSGGYSTYFDGTGDYLQTPTINLTGDFTVEFFISLDELTTDVGIFSFGNLAGANSILELYSNTSGYYRLYSSTGGELNTSNISVDTGKFYHIAVTRSGNTFKAYLDGVEFASDTTARTINSVLTIGGYVNTGYLMKGYIRDFRITTNVQYSSNNFTPPSEPLTAISGTVLLTCHLPYIADGSATPYTMTSYGNVSTKSFSPYDYDEYSAADNGGSVYFDGTTDYLLINSPPTLGANDWTFETWYYASPQTHNNLLSQGPGNNTVVSSFSISGTGEIWIQTYTTTNVVLYNTAAGIIKADTWNHIVLTHDYDGSNGGTYKIYVNGNQVGSNVSYTSGYYWNSGGIAGTALAMAQYRYNTQANGECYFSDWKISSGVTYSSNFTPPTTPLSSSGAELHIKGTDASIIDKSQGSNLKLVGNTTGSTTQVKFANTKSMYFDGTGDYIDATQNWIQLRTSDFTVETWFYPTATPSNHEGIFCYGAHGSGNYLQLLYQTNRLIRYDIYASVGGGSTVNLSTTALSLNTWHHIALCRSGGNIRLYVNGTQEHTEANSSDLNFTQATTGYETIAVIGNRTGLSGYELNSAYLQDLRVTKGLARYTVADETGNIPTEPLKG